jgi:hypothetical protein
MGNETEKDVQHHQPKSTSAEDTSKKNPSHQGPQSANQQDPSKKVPSRGDDSRQND